jgi:hypothetical protein
MKHMNIWFVICAIAGTCAIGWAVGPDDSTNHPSVFPNTNQPIPLGDTNQILRTTTNTSLPPAYQGGIANLHDRIGTNAVNHGNDQPTLTNQPNPNMEMPHVPPQ